MTLPATVPAGVSRIVVKNFGSDPHEIVITQADSVDDLPVADGVVDIDALPKKVYRVMEFAGNTICEGTFDLPAGNYVVVLEPRGSATATTTSRAWSRRSSSRDPMVDVAVVARPRVGDHVGQRHRDPVDPSSAEASPERRTTIGRAHTGHRDLVARVGAEVVHRGHRRLATGGRPTSVPAAASPSRSRRRRRPGGDRCRARCRPSCRSTSPAAGPPRRRSAPPTAKPAWCRSPPGCRPARRDRRASPRRDHRSSSLPPGRG